MTLRLSQLSLHWYDDCPCRTCACGHPLSVAALVGPLTDFQEDGSYNTVCPHCPRVVTVYDRSWTNMPLPRGPAPTLDQRQQGWDDEMAYAAVW